MRCSASTRYHGGALVLYALREKIGTRAFEELERQWVRRYADESVGTEDFIALASKVARREPERLPARLALRRDHSADAEPPRLDRRSGRGKRRGATAGARRQAYSVMTVSSCEYAGAQQQRSFSGASADAQSLCLTPGGITTVSPGPISRSRGCEPHAPAPLCEEVDLLGNPVEVLVRRAAGRDGRLGKALVDRRPDRRAGDLADLRAVERDERLDLVKVLYSHAAGGYASARL